jgi:hypothetical protein
MMKSRTTQIKSQEKLLQSLPFHQGTCRTPAPCSHSHRSSPPALKLCTVRNLGRLWEGSRDALDT